MKRIASLQTAKKKRNQKLRRFFAKLEQANSNWKHESLLQETAEHFDISTRTVTAILNREGRYAD